MNVRRATEADEPLLHQLWDEFAREVRVPPELTETWAEEWEDTRKDLGAGLVLIAEDESGPVGSLRMRQRKNALHLALAYVRPQARRQGVLRALLEEAVGEAHARGADTISLDVMLANEVGTATWRTLGFEPVVQYMTTPLGALEQRLQSGGGAAFGSIHVQTDDRAAVERAVAKFRPRMAPPGGTEISDVRNGWVSVYDEVCERDPEMLKRFARELSYDRGSVVVAIWVVREAVGYAMLDHGSWVDDYLSVPEINGPLPSGDVISLAANPRVVQRLTGADPAVVRAVARNAASPSELPPARELVAQVAATMGIVDADRGYAG